MSNDTIEKQEKYYSNIAHNIFNNLQQPLNKLILIAEEPYLNRIVDEIFELCKQDKDIEKHITRLIKIPKPYGRISLDYYTELRFFCYKKHKLNFMLCGQSANIIYIYDTMQIKKDEDFCLLNGRLEVCQNLKEQPYNNDHIEIYFNKQLGDLK